MREVRKLILGTSCAAGAGLSAVLLVKWQRTHEAPWVCAAARAAQWLSPGAVATKGAECFVAPALACWFRARYLFSWGRGWRLKMTPVTDPLCPLPADWIEVMFCLCERAWP